MTEAATFSETIKKQIPTILWLSILCVYWAAIVQINFSRNPSFYCTDMYADMMFAVTAWREKTIFPPGWVFGNQYYAVATPVLAALMLGFTDDPCIAMGIASTCMGLGVVFSFYWMLGPVFPHRHQRRAAVVLFMTAVLWCGDAVFTVNGWQLFFTMCSYYACYAITAFLSFGCFLRRYSKQSPTFYAMVLLACVFSFGTGIQSLRQTVISVIPMVVAAGWEQITRIRHKQPVSRNTVLLTGALTLSNLAGVLYANTVSAPKHEIFGCLSISPMPDVASSLRNILGLFGDGWILGLAAILAACFCLTSKKRQGTDSFFVFLLLCMVSTVVIFSIDSFSTMHVRSIYYFLLFPMAATVFTHWFAERKTVNCILAVGILLLSLLSGRHSPESLPVWRDDHPLQAVSDCLEDNQISVVFTQWNLGGTLAVASDFRIRVGFWDAADDVFESVEYLCDPSVFDSDPSDCAYVVSGTENLELALDRAEGKQAEICILDHVPELDLYIFTSDQQLMEP